MAAEHSPEGTVIGALKTGSQFPRGNIFFHLVESSASGIFQLDSVTGEIILLKDSLDYERLDGYRMVIRGEYRDSSGILSDTAFVDILVTIISGDMVTIKRIIRQ